MLNSIFKRTKKIVLTMSFFCFGFFFFSCTMSQTVELNVDGAGRVDFDLTLAPYFTEVVSQLAEFAPSENENSRNSDNFFQITEIKDNFSKRKGVNLRYIESPIDEELKGSFTFLNINSAITDEKEVKGSSIFAFDNTGNISTLQVNLSYKSIEELLNDNPWMNSPLMENFGPLANDGLSPDDYLDMMEFVLGEESRESIKESLLNLKIEVDGVIISQTGGELLNNSTVRFEVPLLDILVLSKEIIYSVRFKSN